MPETTTITREGYKCNRCSHEWVPRRPIPPKVCPSCKRTDWYWHERQRNGQEAKAAAE